MIWRKTLSRQRVTVCCDGGVRNKGKVGAIGFVLATPDDGIVYQETQVFHRDVTTSEMEVLAAVYAMRTVRSMYPDAVISLLTDLYCIVTALLGGKEAGKVTASDRYRKSRPRHAHAEELDELRELLRVGDEVRWIPRNSTVYISLAHELVDDVLDML